MAGASNTRQAAKLTRLAQFVTTGAETGINQTPKVETALLWDLLDYAMSTSPIVDSGNSSDNVELNVNTQFLSPVNPDVPRLPSAAIPPRSNVPDTFATSLWDDATFEFDMTSFSNMYDMSSLAMPNEACISGGHL